MTGFPMFAILHIILQPQVGLAAHYDIYTHGSYLCRQ